MAAAYAALVSLRHIIKQLENHPRPPISLDGTQVESLTEKLTFLQEFLEGYSANGGGSEGLEAFESRIADAAYAAEDIIESHIVDRIRPRSWRRGGDINFIDDLVQGLRKVIEDMDSMVKEAIEINENTEIQDDHKVHENSISASSLRSSSTTRQNTMVGFDDVLIEVMDKLTGQQSSRQIIPIVGMGGMGKTTLARNIYVNPLIKHHFDILGWATISQVYNAREICLEVLCEGNGERRENLSQMNEYELGDKIHKSLSGRRYLIIMDDMWSIEAWDKVKLFFPNDNNGSRIMLTTRLSDMAFQLNCSNVHRIDMSFLDENKSWNLLRENVFGKENCPVELEEIGKKIAKNCKGLPLSIAVIGGFLAKSQQTRQHWEHIVENLNSIVNLEEDERCLKILNMSYNHLPVHLKPCFLYMGVFPEDSRIRVSSLVKLWVAEGFLKPIHGKSSEMVAEEYLKDLISRNLVLVDKLGSGGNMKTCRVHDLLRDLCLRKAQKERFLNVTKLDNISRDVSTQRRICIPPTTTDGNLLSSLLTVHSLFNYQFSSLARSVIGKIDRFVLLSRFRLLRVWNAFDTNRKSQSYGNPLDGRPLGKIFELVNLRYLAVRLVWYKVTPFPYSVHLWNLETLIVNLIHSANAYNTPYSFATIPLFDIWKMPQLKHVKFDKLDLVDPPTDDDFVVMENLKTLSTVRNFKCGEEVIKRIPNIKKLGIEYKEFEELSSYCLDNLGRLCKLESLSCFFPFKGPSRNYLVENLIFPCSLKKLSLYGGGLHWDDMTTKIGSLPNLQVLKLKMWSFKGPKWETVEGQFRSLRFLRIESCDDLKYWRTESTHFPRLERLVLGGLHKLKEVPSCIGDIVTLQSIELEYCNPRVVDSAKEIVEEQEELGNVGLQIRISEIGKW